MHGRSSPIQVELLERSLSADQIEAEHESSPDEDGIDTSN